MKNDLILPVYIDTNALLDLLASIEGGFSVIEKITTQSSQTSNTDRGVKADAGTEFGIPNVLSMLKVNLGYSSNWKKGQEEGQVTEAEKYHTYGSLLFRLREYLDANKLIKRADDDKSWETIQPTDFIEIRGVFRPNPLANSLEIIDKLLGIIQLFDTDTLSSRKSSAQKQTPDEKKRVQEAKQKAQAQAKQMEEIRKFLKGISSDIQAENIRAFVLESSSPAFKSVVLLYLNYLRDQTMTEISYKEYHLLGKVVRKIEADSADTVDLLLGTGLGGIGKDTLQELVGMFGQMPGMNLPEVETEISGPALEIVPIAIYV